MMSKTLKNYSTLIEITCKLSSPKSQKRSKRAVDAIVAECNVDESQVTGSKKLWSTADIAKTLRTTIASIGGQLAQWSTSHDKGKYQIQSSRFEECKTFLDAQMVVVNNLLDEMACQYPALIDAERAAKGDLFDLGDYETPDEIRAKKPSWGFQPSPDSATLAACFDDSEFARDVIRDFEIQQRSKHVDIDAQLFDRCSTELIDGVAAKIAKFLGSGKGISAVSVFDQIRYGLELARRNMTDCSRLDKIRQVVGRIVNAFDADNLRDPIHSAAIREDIRSAFGFVLPEPVAQDEPNPKELPTILGASIADLLGI